MNRLISWRSPTVALVTVFAVVTALTLLLMTVAAMSIPGPEESRRRVDPASVQQPAAPASGTIQAGPAPAPEPAQPADVSAQSAAEPAAQVGDGVPATGEHTPATVASTGLPAAAEQKAPASTEPTRAAPPVRSASAEVTIVNFSFQPATLTVPVGATVTWVNNDTAPHTATADAGLWDSGLLARGGGWSKTFAEPGTFSYFCDFHPEMRGTVIVGDGAGPVAPATAPTTAPAPEPAPPPPPVSSSAKQVNAQIVNDSFSPATITVAVGDVITWTNNDRKRHTVTAQDGSFNSGSMGGGAQWSYTATTAGTFAYICDFHSRMRGTLVVTGGGGSPAELPAFEPQPDSPSYTQPLTPAPTPGSTSVVPSRAEISLSGGPTYPNVRGTARFEDEGEGIRLRVELNGASALGGSSLDVLIGGTKVGSMGVEERGRARLDLRGSTSLPATVAGATLEVRTPQGVLVASGTF